LIARAAHTPERTCVGCRKRDRLAALVRLAADGDHVVVDVRRRRPGRGAWVHPEPRCTARLATGALEKSFKRKLAPAALTPLCVQINRRPAEPT
jgi:uncharacterized protein